MKSPADRYGHSDHESPKLPKAPVQPGDIRREPRRWVPRVLALLLLGTCAEIQAASPTITSITLGAEGSTNRTVVDRFTIGFSAEMQPAAINALTNYDLRAAGEDGVFNTIDDVTSYSLGSPGYGSGLTATYLISSGPLQAGHYRFTATTNLMDQAGNRLATDFVRTFWVAAQRGFTVESRDNDISAGATPLSLMEDPSGLLWGVGQGNLSSSSDLDWWVFNGSQGQSVSVAMSTPGELPDYRWNCSLSRPGVSGWQGSGLYAGASMGAFVMPEGGEYRLCISPYWYTATEYWVRVSVAVPPMQMESEDNGALSKANRLQLAPGAAGSQTAQVAGCVDYNDSAGDFFALGTLAAGVEVNLDLAKPVASPLVGQLTLYRDGTYVALSNDGETHLSYAVPSGAEGQYYVRVKSVGESWGLLSQYVLSIQVTNDFARPAITGVSLGEEGGTNRNVVDRFTLSFSEDLYSPGVNAITNYELRAAGADGVFGTGDDVSGYAVLTPGYSNGLTATLLINNGPLQPGHYRFTATTNLMDRAGNRLAANFVRTFWVAAQPGFTVESRDNDISAGATPLALVEEPSGLLWSVGQGNLASSSDLDWWVFNGSQGQLVSVAMSTPGELPDYRWNCNLYRPGVSGWQGSGLYAGASMGAFVMPEGGEYRLCISPYWYTATEYWVRVSVAVPPMQMESEDNGALSKANPLQLAPGAAGSQTGQVAGCVDYNDSAGDFFALGTLAGGVTVNLDLAKPGASPLVGQLTLYREGTYVALGNDGETHLSYAVPGGAEGQYYVRVKSVGGSWGLLSQYVLSIQVTNDSVRPVITAVSLGEEGSTNRNVVSRFTLSFSEDLHSPSVNAITNYELRAAGVDGVFGTADDVSGYAIASPGYSNGLAATFLINNGPLQPGHYRLTATTNLTDRAGNRLGANLVRAFWVAAQPGFTIESRDNDSSAGATPLSLVEEPSGLLWSMGQGNLASSSDRDWWVFNGSQGQLVSVAMSTPGELPDYRWYCDLYRPGVSGWQGNYLYAGASMGAFVMPEGGEYRLQVSPYSYTATEYWVRVSVAVPPMQMESENNGAISRANSLQWASGLGGSQTARVAGCVDYNDTDGDYFALGTLSPGVTINLDLTKPALSPLLGQMTLYRDGTSVALGNEGETHLSHTIPSGEGGQYCARIKSVNGTWGLLSQYVLELTVGNGSSPTITSDSTLPSGTVGAAYSCTLMATGGTPPYVWQLASSSPAGLTLNTNTGTISGAPTVAGSVSFLVRARGANGLAGVKVLGMSIYATSPGGYHTADYRDPRWAIDGTEASRVLAYWRAGAYHVDSSGWDGYAGGAGSTNGPRHGADYNTNYWVIDGTEANRVLSYWRAGQYHADTNGLDGYAPGPSGGSISRKGFDPGSFLSVAQEAPATYSPGSPLTVKIHLGYTAQPLSLLWRPRLPAGWKLLSVTGDGKPEANTSEVLWSGAIPSCQANVELTVEVPAGDCGLRWIEGDAEGHFTGQPNPARVAVAPLALGEAGSGFSELSAVPWQTNGQVRLRLRAELGRQYAIQVSQDLAVWETWTTVLNQNGTLELVDPAPLSNQRRFYRACLVP